MDLKGRDTARCEGCNRNDIKAWFCAACGTTLCDRCWDTQIAHRSGRTGLNGLLHEKSDVGIAKWLKGLFNPTSDPREQQQLHQEDLDTIWFGLIRDISNQPGLQEYGRYTKLMQSSFTGEWQERWPHIVSFIGQTGSSRFFAQAGESSNC